MKYLSIRLGVLVFALGLFFVPFVFDEGVATVERSAFASTAVATSESTIIIPVHTPTYTPTPSNTPTSDLRIKKYVSTSPTSGWKNYDQDRAMLSAEGGDTLYYRIVVWNIGQSDAANVDVEDAFLAGSDSYIESFGDYDELWTLETVSATTNNTESAGKVITYDAKVDTCELIDRASVTLRNEASVTGEAGLASEARVEVLCEQVTSTPTKTPTPINTSTPRATYTVQPTYTPLPTYTPRPTSTPQYVISRVGMAAGNPLVGVGVMVVLGLVGGVFVVLRRRV